MSSRQIVARATSLAASTGLLALAIAGALSVSYVVQENFPPAPPPITSIEPEPAPPPPIPHTNPPPQQPQLQHVIEIPSLPATISTIASTPLLTDFSFLTGPPGPPNITDPRWLREPRDLARYYPARAQQMGVEGSATLDCAVDVTGALHCSVVAESPSGWNFGAAALRISQDYRMAPAMRGDQAVEARYRMRIPFEIPDR